MPVKLLAGAEPFFIPGGHIGCLCLHGLTASPQEMAWLGEHLAAQGATVYVPRLNGHGIHPEYLARTHWQDWYASALDGYHLLARQCDQVFVMGLSMGGLLSLLLSAHEPVSGAVIMAAPLVLSNPALRWVHVLRRFVRYVPTSDKPDLLGERIAVMQRERGQRVTGRVSYRGQYTMAGLSELVHLQDQVNANLSKITAPLLLVYSEGDKTVNINDMETVRAGVASQDVQTLRLVESDHILTNDVDHPRVFAAAWSFIEAHSPQT